MSKTSLIAMAMCLAGLGGCAAQVAPVSGMTPSAQSAQSAHDVLFKLFADSDEASLRLNPLNALDRGDMRYADQFGDLLSDDHIAKLRAQAEHELAALRAIDRSALDATDQIAYDAFEYNTRDTLRSLDPDILALTKVRPFNHFYGYHIDYATLSSGEGGAPFKTVEDYENALKRHDGFVHWIDASIARFREGQRAGVVETKMTVRNVIEQLDGQLSAKVEDSTYYGPIRKLPETFSAQDKARLTTAYRDKIANQIFPALTRLRDFMKNDYLASAREGHGLLYMKGGDTLYRYLVKSRTTLDLDPETVHRTGLSEVARILREMDKIQSQVGFKGTRAQFFEFLRTDAQFQAKSRQELTNAYYAIGKEVEAKLPAYFSTFPKTKLEIRPYPEFREKFQAGGGYEAGTPDGSRPGVFYFNAYDLPVRSLWGVNTLFLHEGSPGHHFQISLAQENESLPAFMRFDGPTAFFEGWALYAETLGYDMGVYDDPYQRFGTLNDEMLRAMRLVVDTGIHAKGWTREQAIDYMLANSGLSRTDITAEVERYIAIPGQALAYKTGSMTIQRLRDKAKAALGDKFDIRDFHAQVLMTGALPMKVLEDKIDRWIAAKQAG